jgi:hypothetical protein
LVVEAPDHPLIILLELKVLILFLEPLLLRAVVMALAHLLDQAALVVLAVVLVKLAVLAVLATKAAIRQ